MSANVIHEFPYFLFFRFSIHALKLKQANALSLSFPFPHRLIEIKSAYIKSREKYRLYANRWKNPSKSKSSIQYLGYWKNPLNSKFFITSSNLWMRLFLSISTYWYYIFVLIEVCLIFFNALLNYFLAIYVHCSFFVLNYILISH